MYSGMHFTKFSGRIMGVHQKIDRIARRHVGELLPKTPFPTTKEILRFEGKRGPDGIKVKSPARNEPWHFLDPFNEDNEEFLKMITDHHELLVKHLKDKNKERAAFEAAWLAHAIVDGLTPAHHYPYEKEIEKLRGGASKESRTTKREKVIFKGDTKVKTFTNTFKAMGPKGLMTNHWVFEHGIAYLIKPLNFPDARPSATDIEELQEIGEKEFFIRRAREIASLDLYEKYIKTGWTPKLSNQIRHGLMPAIVKTVTVFWYSAAYEANT